MSVLANNAEGCIVAVTQLLVRQRVERNGRCAVRVELKLYPCTHTYNTYLITRSRLCGFRCH